MRQCKICGSMDDEVEFYSSINMYCKEHWKEKVRENRKANPDHYKEFDRNRASQPERVALRKAYQKTIAFKESHLAANEKYRKNHPQKKYAQGVLARAVSSGKVERLPCFVCGELCSEGHHPNYDAPVDVIWLCDTHHKEVHVLGRNIIRDEQSLVHQPRLTKV